MKLMRARLSSKGQLVLPKEIRERRGLGLGSEVELEEVPGGVLMKFVRGPEGATLDDLIGCAGYRGRRRTLDEMAAAIGEGARARR
jgi:AbrB family looped-hinge helix DNA binding protein